MTDILPKDREDAIRRMIGLTRELITLTEAEAEAVGNRDPEQLKIALARKDDLTVTYEKAGKEFHKRIAEFKGVDKKLIAKWQGHQDGGKLIMDTYTEAFGSDDERYEAQELAKIAITKGS